MNKQKETIKQVPPYKGMVRERKRKTIMTITSASKIEVLAKNFREGDNRQKFYNLAIMVNGEAGNISCSEEVYDRVKLRAENELVFAYNDRYKSFRAIDVVPENAAAAAEKPDQKPGK